MTSDWVIHEGDCLEVLPALPRHAADVAVADPPYIIGGTSIAEPRSKAGTWADMVNAATWYREWFDAVAEALKPNAYLLVFGSWRSLPTYLCAAARSTLFPASCMVWNKEWIGPAPERALRPTWELILWLAMPEAIIPNRSASDYISQKWSAAHSGESGHAAEKPRALIRRLLEIAAPSGGVVVDPFAGSGTVGLAAIDLGMGYCGIEADPAWVARTRVALESAVTQPLLEFRRGWNHETREWSLDVQEGGRDSG